MPCGGISQGIQIITNKTIKTMERRRKTPRNNALVFKDVKIKPLYDEKVKVIRTATNAA